MADQELLCQDVHGPVSSPMFRACLCRSLATRRSRRKRRVLTSGAATSRSSSVLGSTYGSRACYEVQLRVQPLVRLLYYEARVAAPAGALSKLARAGAGSSDTAIGMSDAFKEF